MVIGMGIALLMTKMSRPVRLLAQTGLLLAWAMPVLATLTVWQWLFDTQYGIVNWLLTRLGGSYEGHSWLLEPLSFFFVAAVIVVWMSVPFVAFTGYAALTQVPEDLVEAAELDGAGTAGSGCATSCCRASGPVLLVVGLLEIIWGLRVFTQIYVLQEAGGVTRETNLLGTHIYRLGIAGGDFGTAAAVAIFMLVLTVVLTAPYVRTMLRNEELEEAGPDVPPHPHPRPTRRRPGRRCSSCWSARSRSTGWSTPRSCRATRSARPTRRSRRSTAPSPTTAGCCPGTRSATR